jgi:hypothetical protein
LRSSLAGRINSGNMRRHNGEAAMWRWGTYGMIAGVVGLIFGIVGASAQSPVGQPTSEGHPSKWQTTDKSFFDLISDGYKLITVVYDTSQTGQGAEPDVHYFLEKGNIVARCDFRKRDQTSYYWCSQLAKVGP